MTNARRVVAEARENGKSYIALDEAIPTSDPGQSVSLTNIWIAPITRIDAAAPYDSGFIPFAMSQMSAASYAMTVVDYAPGVGQIDPGMHVTATVDHFYVVQGEIVLVLHVGEAILRAGDAGIIRGAAHGWRNDGLVTARLVFFVLPTSLRN